MSLASGVRLGPYEILAAIGAGGMGEVYRARDTRLDREVAVKVLPPAFSADADRRARFEREAKAVAALSHTNIVALYDTGIHDGQLFVVMELVDGETLRKKLVAGEARAGTAVSGLPVRKAVDIAVQMARGLGAAHSKGLVHRDLKPENVIVTSDGHVKILDFGLARQAANGSDAVETVAALTDPGTVVGTVGYMAPEQVRGQEVDARADLFALGAVLYELLSGQRAFAAGTAAETMTAVLREDPPDLTVVRPGLSPALDRIVRHSLEKNPADRFQSARDVAFALEALSGSTVSQASGSVRSVHPRARWALPAIFAVVAIGALAGGVLLDRMLGHQESREIRFETKTWDAQAIPSARFGPDGKTIVFGSAITGNVPSLFVIRPGNVTAEPFGPPGTHLLSISSKGDLAVLTNSQPLWQRVFSGTLARMTMDGAPRALMEDVTEADWSPDGASLAVIRRAGGKWRLEYPVGNLLCEVAAGYLSDLRVSPSGREVAFFEHPYSGDDRGWVKVVNGAKTVRTLAGENWGEQGLAWSPDGRFVFFSASDGGQEAYRALKVNVSGTPRTSQAFATVGVMFVQDTAADGRLLVLLQDSLASIRGLVPGEPAEREFSWLNAGFLGFLSRDGKALLFSDESQRAGANYGVALRDVATGKVVRLGEGMSSALSPDAKWAPAMIPSTGRLVLYPTGPGESVALNRGSIEHYRSGVDFYLPLVQWFPDSRRILVCGNEPGKQPRCYTQDVPGGTPTPLTEEGTSQVLLGADGRTFLAFGSDRDEVRTIGGAGVVPARGLTSLDAPLGWTADGRSVVVTKKGSLPARLDRVDLSTGQRTFIRELAPPDRAGLIFVVPTQWMEDGRGYSYTYLRVLSKVFVVSGVQP